MLILLLLIAHLMGCQQDFPDQAALEAFANDFRQANQATSIEPMLELYELKGSSAETKTMLKNALLFELGTPVANIHFLEYRGGPEQEINFVHKGQTYGPTLIPTHRMHVRYDTKDRFESIFTIGRDTAGDYRIVSSRPIQVRP